MLLERATEVIEVLVPKLKCNCFYRNAHILQYYCRFIHSHSIEETHWTLIELPAIQTM